MSGESNGGTERQHQGALHYEDKLSGVMRHELKCWNPFFAAVLNDTKPFEVRRHDRPFAEGDELLLRETLLATGDYTGRELTRRITYILVGGQFGIEPGYCVLGLAS